MMNGIKIAVNTHASLCIVRNKASRNILHPMHFSLFVHQVNQTTYFVEDLEPNTGYQFRVIALKQNQSSSFSNWSDVINTTSKHNFKSNSIVQPSARSVTLRKFIISTNSCLNYYWRKMNHFNLFHDYEQIVMKYIQLIIAFSYDKLICVIIWLVYLSRVHCSTPFIKPIVPDFQSQLRN